MTETNERRLLGVFLRAHRERLPPPRSAGRRRTPGLRREELAEAAGLSATWITWLEQGRKVTASASALARLADVLRLSAPERASLFDLAGKRDPSAPATGAEIRTEWLELTEKFAGPAYLLDHAWTARAWNAAAAELFVGWLDPGASERNLLAFVLLDPAAGALIGDWSARARRLVAEFHADFHRRRGDADMAALVDRLTGESRQFASWWSDQTVLGREGGERVFNHPRRGAIAFRQTTLLVAARPEIKLVCLTQS